MSARWFILLILLTHGALPQAGCACTIPVFRYALDRWEADKFHLLLPAAASQDLALNDLLRPLRADGKANLDIRTSRDAALDQPELRFSTRDESVLWTGKLDSASLAALLDSPTRTNIRDHILAGDSIVWVMADRGTPEDEAHAQRIERRLKFLEQVAALPIQDPNDPDSQLGPGPPLKLKFTLVRLRSDDPAEQMLVKMLTGPKREIDPSTTSFAAAVFGRGRVLGAWPLDALDHTALEDACMFLVGRCSCRMKNENPGWDILMNVDWAAALEKVIAAAAPSAASAAKMVAPPEAVPTMLAAAPDGNVIVKNSVVIPIRWPWLAAGAAFVLSIAAVILLWSGKAGR